VMVPLLLFMPFGPLLAWKRGDLLGVAQRLLFAAIIAVATMAVTYGFYFKGPLLAPFGLALGVYVMVGALSEMAFRVKLGRAPLEEVKRRIWNQPRSSWGTTLAHFGVGLMVIGIVATSAYRVERILVLKPGEETVVAGYTLKFRGEAPRRGPNYKEQIGVLDVFRNGSQVTRLMPSKRRFTAPVQVTSEAGILASWAGDLYTVLGDRQNNGGFAFRIYFNPLVRFIWIGALIMFLGGLVSLSDRRLRVGAPMRSRRRVVTAPAE